MREEGVCGARPVCVPVAVSVHLSGLGIVVTELAVQAHVSEVVAAELVHQDGVSDEMTMAAELGILDGKVAASALAVSRMMGIVRRTTGRPASWQISSTAVTMVSWASCRLPVCFLRARTSSPCSRCADCKRGTGRTLRPMQICYAPLAASRGAEKHERIADGDSLLRTGASPFDDVSQLATELVCQL